MIWWLEATATAAAAANKQQQQWHKNRHKECRMRLVRFPQKYGERVRGNNSGKNKKAQNGVVYSIRTYLAKKEKSNDAKTKQE